jgi:hypothetical protein
MHIVFIFLITIIIAYLFGFIIVNLIDNRLSKITINIPVQEKFENENEKKNKNEIENKIEISESKKYNFKTGELDKEYYNQMNRKSKVEGFSDSPDNSFKTWDFEKKKTQTCIKNHIHDKNGKDLNCTYGLTNYADPKDMSSIDYKIFNLNYPTNMTLQDYINWLYCYIDNEDQLPYNHLKNLEKLKIGKELIEEHGILPPPSYYYPALNSEDYFNKMYNETNEFNIASPLNSNTASMLGYNYNEYSEFVQNMDVYGSTGKIRNTDIAYKKNAKQLYDYINPKDSNSLNIEKEYEKYHIKDVEI